MLEARWEALPGNIRGAIWILLAGVFFTVMSAMIKYLGSRIPVVEILFVRQMVMVGILAPSLLRDPIGAFRTPYPLLHAGRVALSVVAMMAGFLSIVHMPLADGVSIGFSKSFFTTIFAIIILGEVVGPHRWGATIVGFLGVVVMLKPSPEHFDIYALYGVISAAAAGLILVIIRKLAQREKLVTVMSYQSIGVGLVFAVPAWLVWVPPTMNEFMLMATIGLFSAIGQSCNFRAFRVGEAAAITSMDYVRLVYAALLGVFVFGEWPGQSALAGTAIIIGASLYAIRHERRVARRAREAAERERLAAAEAASVPAE